MDTFELNKVLGAVLGTLLVVLALNITAGAIFSPEMPAKPGYEIAVQEQPGAGAAEAPAAAEEPLEKRLASATVGGGQQAARKCQACHTFEKGGPNRVGPNLWGIVGRPKASIAGFNYSAALRAMGGEWTIQELDKYLLSPRGMVPGTNMAFAGVPRGSERADLIAYLNSLSDNPAPLPKAADAPAGPDTPPGRKAEVGGQPGSQDASSRQ